MTTLVLNKTEQKSRLVQALVSKTTDPVEVMIKAQGRRYRVRVVSADALRTHMRVNSLSADRAKRPAALSKAGTERKWAINNFGEANTAPIR